MLTAASLPSIVSRPKLGTLVVSGPERRIWLQGVLTCDLRDLRPGQGRYGLVLARNGHVLTDTTVVAAEAALWLSTAPETARGVHEHLERLLVMEDAALEERSSEFGWTLVLGAEAGAWAASAAAEVGGVAGAAAWPGLRGAGVVAARGQADAVRDALRRTAGTEVHVLDDDGWTTLRIERGLVEFGVDYDAAHTPHQASLDQSAVSWTKGCYVGQDFVARQQSRGGGIERLVWLTSEDSAPVAPGVPVHAHDRSTIVGRVTSAAFSPRLGRTLAIARLRVPHAESGTRVVVAGSAATVSRTAPFGEE